MKRWQEHSSMLQPGAKLILLYVLTAYLVPSVLIELVGFPSDTYREVQLNGLALVMLSLTFLVYLIVGNSRVHSIQTVTHWYEFRFFSSGFQLMILGSIVVAAALGFLEGVSGWRYSVEGLSERGSLLAFMAVLISPFLYFFLLVYLFYDRRFAERRGISQSLKKALLVTGLFLSANGIATMLLAMLGTVFVLFPRTVRSLIFRTMNKPVSSIWARLQRRVGLVSLIGISAGVALLGWILGEAIKRGEIGSVVDLASSAGFLEWIFMWATHRSSPSYVSLLIALDEFALSTDWSVITQHLLAPVDSFLFRANYLLMNFFDVARPQDGSIMRVNYLLISVNPVNVREGTAPGLFAGFLYSFPFPLNFLVLIGYLLFVQRLLNRLIGGLAGQLTLVGWLVFLTFMLPLFASPIDLLLIIDDAVIAFVLIILLRQVCIRRLQALPPPTRADLGPDNIGLTIGGLQRPASSL